MGELLAMTRVRHGDKYFEVSTINRESSAVAMHGDIYAETLVFSVQDNWVRGNIIGQAEASRGSLYAHQRMVERLFNTGSTEEEEC